MADNDDGDYVHVTFTVPIRIIQMGKSVEAVAASGTFDELPLPEVRKTIIFHAREVYLTRVDARMSDVSMLVPTKQFIDLVVAIDNIAGWISTPASKAS